MNGRREPGVSSRSRVLVLPRPAAVAFAQRGAEPEAAARACRCRATRRTTAAFVFVRLRYSAAFGRYGNWIGDGGVPWSHDYPDGEVHFSKILEELTLLNIRTDGSNILALDDPELFNYPVAYMAEPGYWGADGRRGGGVPQLPAQGRLRHLRRLPRRRTGTTCRSRCASCCRRHAGSSSIGRANRSSIRFSRFRTRRRCSAVDLRRQFTPSLLGDLREQRSGEAHDRDRQRATTTSVSTGSFPTPASRRSICTNEAYKFGVNYVMYALTH